VVAIAREDLVGALAGEGDLVLGSDGSAEQVEGRRVVRAHRLGHRVDGVVDGTGELRIRHPDAVVIGRVGFGHRVGPGELVALVPAPRLEADAVGGHAVPALLGEQGDEEARVETSREQHRDGHVSREAAAHRAAQGVVHELDPVAGAEPGVHRTALVVGLPVAPVGHPPGPVDHAHRRRRELPHPRQHRVLARNDRVPAEVVVEARRVDGGVDAAAREEGRQGRRETQPAGLGGEVERFDAEPVTGQHHAAAGRIDDHEGEHADEVVDDPLAPAAVPLEDHLGVAQRPEALGGELPAQLVVVVDAAVEGDRRAGQLVDHGLGAAVGEVDDAEAAVAEHRPAARPKPVAVGAAVGLRGDGPRRPLPVEGASAAAPEVDLSRDAAHQRATACSVVLWSIPPVYERRAAPAGDLPSRAAASMGGPTGVRAGRAGDRAGAVLVLVTSVTPMSSARMAGTRSPS
jgi:hypothetical protein